MKNHTKLKL